MDQVARVRDEYLRSLADNAAGEEGWRALWMELVVSRPSTPASVRSISILCIWGWAIAIRDGDVSGAMERLIPWFEHPDRSSAPGPEWFEVHTRAGIASLLVGKQVEAAQYFAAAAASPDGSTYPVRVIADRLLGAVRELAPETPIAPELASLPGSLGAPVSTSLAATAAELVSVLCDE